VILGLQRWTKWWDVYSGETPGEIAYHAMLSRNQLHSPSVQSFVLTDCFREFMDSHGRVVS